MQDELGRRGEYEAQFRPKPRRRRGSQNTPRRALAVNIKKIALGAVAELVGIEVGVVSGVINLESSGVEASDWRLRHEQAYHEARFLAACD